MSQPPCGLYRTRHALADKVPAGRLVYFHNHGDPGPGVYLPEAWSANRARFHRHGATVPDEQWASRSLEPLAPEGLYRVREAFHCCEKRCRLFEAELLVQLGYDAEAHALLFVPEWIEGGLAIAETGTRIDAERVSRLAPLRVVQAAELDGDRQ